jgi:hypothetical protein
MKKILTITVIGLLCVSMFSVFTPRVMGWASSIPSALHEEMARDALQGTRWSDLEIADIAFMAFGGRSIDEWPFEYYADYYHRVQLYQDMLHIYHGLFCDCDEQGSYGGAEDGAYQCIQWARSNYTIGNEAEARRCLGRAIHFIQDSVCPPHVFPFKEGTIPGTGPHADFESWTAEDPMVYQAFWSARVRGAEIQPLESAADLRSKLRVAAAEVWTRFSSLSSGFGYLRQDGELIGDCSGEFFANHDWNMPIDGIGWCMEKAASLVKGAAIYVMGGVPPEVVCVPFHGKWLGVPHDAWIGKEIVLKGTAHDPDGDSTLAAYKWDFGDGYSTDWIAGVNPYVIEAKHTYTGTMADGTPYGVGKYFTAWLYVRDADGLVGQDSYFIAIRDKTLDVEVNVAIDDGLWWLHKQAYRYTSGGIDYAMWSSIGYSASATADSVLAFEIQGHQPIGNPDEDPYVETVQRGLNYAFSQTRVVDISAWGPGTGSPYGDPDTNGNDIGIGISSGQEVYELGMVMMAIAASGDPDLTANTGPTGVAGRTYKDILTDMVDLCAWGQNDYGGARGGWRYGWNYGSSDNSVSQWPMMALEAAETNWGIVAPGFVKTELDTYWLTYSQNADGSFGYSGPGGSNIARTGTGIIGLNYVGLLADNPRIVKAVNWLGTYWSEFGNYYGMYAVMKAMRTVHPEITMVGAHDWYAEYARYLVDNQQADRGWPDYYGRVLATDWAILIMTPTVTKPGPVADAGSDVDNFPPTIPLEFDASGSHHMDPTKSIVLYEWDFDSDGTWDYTGTDLEVEHAYPAYYNPDGSIDWDATAKDYTATLRVTDNSDPPLLDTDTCVIHITAPPWKPVADPDGPYEAYPGVPIQLDGSKSYDPESKMYTEEHPWYETIAKYEWDLDNDGQFDDSTEINPSYTWASKGTYSVGLKVTDSQPSGPGGTIGPLDVDIKYTTVVIKAFSIQFYKVQPLFDDFDIERGGILTAYFSVTASDGVDEIPANDVPVHLDTVLEDKDEISKPYLGVDGIIKVSYDLSEYSGDSFEVFVVTDPYNGFPVHPPAQNPVIYNIRQRTSRLVFGTTHSCSAAAIAKVEGEYGEEFAVTNDGSQVLDVTYSQYGKIGVGIEFNLFKAKLGVVKVEGGISATTGVSSGLEWQFTNLDNPTQNQIIKNCITRWILTNIIPISGPLSPLALAARHLIDARNNRLGIDNYLSLAEADGYLMASGQLEASIGISSKHGSSRSLGNLAYAGVSGDIELRVSMNVYDTNKIGFSAEFSFDSSIGAGLGLGMGFLNVDGGFSEIHRFSTKIGVEFIYEGSQMSTIQLNFEIEIPGNLYNFLTFTGLAIPLKDLSIPSELASVKLCLQYSLPMEKLAQSVKDYLSAVTKGEVEYDALWDVIYKSVVNSMIPYSVRLESETDISIELGVSIDGLSAEVGWKYYEQRSFLLEKGFVCNLHEWPVEEHMTSAESIGSLQFIVDRWIYSGKEPQPSGTVLELNEEQSRIYLHVYDEQGRHVGLNYTTGQIETQIPGSYYYDNENGTIVVVLPAELCQFTVEIDGTYAEQDTENYTLAITALSSNRADQKVFSSSIQSGDIQTYQIYIPATGSPILFPWDYLRLAIEEITSLRNYATQLYYNKKIGKTEYNHLMMDLSKVQKEIERARKNFDTARNGYDDKMKGFEDLRHAVMKLKYIIKDVQDWAKKGKIPAANATWIISELGNIRMKLVDEAWAEALAERALALKAIAEAKALGKDTAKAEEEIAKVDRELAKAEQKIAEGKLAQAIQHFKHAFAHSQHAIKKAYDPTWTINYKDWIDELEEEDP